MVHSQNVRFNESESVCGDQKEFTTDVTIEEPQAVTNTISDENKLPQMSPQKKQLRINDEQRTVENCSEPVEGRTESPAVTRSQRETKKPITPQYIQDAEPNGTPPYKRKTTTRPPSDYHQ